MSSRLLSFKGFNRGRAGERNYFTMEDLRVLDLMDNPVYIGDMKQGQKKWYFANKAGTTAINQTLEQFLNADLSGQSQGTDDYQNELYTVVQCAEQRLERLKTIYPNGKPLSALQISRPIRLKIHGEENPRILLIQELKLLDSDNLETAVAAEMNLQSETIALCFDAESQALEHANQKATTFYDIPPPKGVKLRYMQDMFSYTLWPDETQKEEVLSRIRALTLDSNRIQLECEMAMPGSKDTSWFMFYFIPAPNPVNGRLMVIVNQHNVTMQHLQSEQLLATKAQEQFVSAVSHELRTPLNGIIGLSDSLLQSPDCTARIAKMVEQVKSSGLRLAEMVDDIIDAASVTKAQVQIKHETVDLHQIAAKACASAQAMCQRGVELRSEVSAGFPCVDGDSERITQVLSKLVHNATKFTIKGSITISTRMLEEQKEVVCEVTDTGVGIPREKWERIWSPFTQVDMSSTRNHGGTGLGLTLVKKLVEAHGGRVGLKSRWTGDMTGSTFFFILPQRQPTRLQTLSSVDFTNDMSAGREAEVEMLRGQVEALSRSLDDKTLEMERLHRTITELERDVRGKAEGIARSEPKRTASASSAALPRPRGLPEVMSTSVGSASAPVRSHTIVNAVNQHLLMYVELQEEELRQREALHRQQHDDSASLTRALLNDIQTLAPHAPGLGSNPLAGSSGPVVDPRPPVLMEIGRETVRGMSSEGGGRAKWGQSQDRGSVVGAASAQLVPRPRELTSSILL